MLVGLTIVAFGTSAPELVVSLQAGFNGLGSIAVGNVVGSNIFNIAVILGLSAIIYPIKVNIQILRFDIPIMIVLSILACFLLRDSMIDRFEGIILTTGIVLFIILEIYLGKKSALQVEVNVVGSEIKKEKAKKFPIFLDIVLIVSGLAALVIGSKFFVQGATHLAQLLNISDAVIGLTIIAAGTSLPELATSIVAAIKHEEDIAVGNIIGSNIFNILAILGISSTITPLTATGIKPADLAFMTATAIILLPLMRTGFRLVRIEGCFLLLTYAGYLWFLWPK